MKDFHDIANILSTYPTVTAKDCSGAGATDGTPAISAWVNNFWGIVQAALNRAGLTPSGILEAWAAEVAFSHATPGEATMRSTSNQFRTALQMMHGGPGELVLWSRSQAPATVGARVLLLQGQTIAVATYPDLCNAVYCGDAANNTVGVPFYLSSDSGGVTRATTGTWLTLPDARGVTIRGIDTGHTRDPNGATRGGGTPNGSIELDALQGHYDVTALGNATTPRLVSTINSGGGIKVAVQDSASGSATTSVYVSDGVTYESVVNGTPRVASETRMINMACYIGIRY
jgi:hypothetical protein